MSHTPGPWYADKIDDRAAFNIFAHGGTHALLTISAADTNNVEADARLIAAAPIMLQALREIACYDPTKLDAATLGNIARRALAVASAD